MLHRPTSLTVQSTGTDGIIKKIRETVGDRPVYLSIDVSGIFRFLSFLIVFLDKIDSIDPAFAPATGTPETGGWSTRELRTILRGLDGLKIISADLVEVAPAYDTNAELVRSPLMILFPWQLSDPLLLTDHYGCC